MHTVTLSTFTLPILDPTSDNDVDG